MRARVVALVVLVCGAPAVADEHAPLRAAREELKIARQHLQDAGRAYGGHRQAAIEHVNQALTEIRLALEAQKAGAVERPRRETTPDADDD